MFRHFFVSAEFFVRTNRNVNFKKLFFLWSDISANDILFAAGKKNQKMRELRDVDFWTFPAAYRCITTNGVLRSDRRRAVMGKGIALQAVHCAENILKPPANLEVILGAALIAGGNHVHVLEPTKFISFPTKNDWRRPSDVDLIRRSACELRDVFFGEAPKIRLGPDDMVLLPPPGCGNGGLSWPDVKPILAEILIDNRFCVAVGENART